MGNVSNKIQSLSSSVGDNEFSGVGNYIATPELESNFDVTADWSLASVTDQASFESLLTSQGATSVLVSNFDLTGGRLKALIDTEGIGTLDLSFIDITEILKIGGFENVMSSIVLIGNLLTTFNPSTPLPSSLTALDLSGNQIATFNPSVALPNSLTDLDLTNNLLTTFNPSTSLPSSLSSLRLSGNQLTTFNPSIFMPVSLVSLDLSNNSITTAGYTTSETWATAQPSFTNPCDIVFSGNTNSVSGTNLETILLTKNAVITP